jgi:putative lipoic acid-binding regulatory protein
MNHFEVALDAGAYTAQTSPYALDASAVADGLHMVHVKAIDNTGNELVKDVPIYLDKSAPADFAPTADPAAWTNANSVNITFSTTDAASYIDHYQVALDGGAYATQSSPYALDVTGVADGPHTVHVKAIDGAGNELAKDLTISLDKAAPADFTPTANPASWTNANGVEITFATTDALSGFPHFEVALDGGAYTTQASPYTLDVSAVADGTHSVHVKAIDLAGNELVKDVAIYLDKSGPADFTPTANPASWTNANSVSISFDTTDAGCGMGHYEVALDGGAYTTQTSPYALDVTAVADGTHTVHVKAIDAGGNELIKDVTIYLDKTNPADFTPSS